VTAALATAGALLVAVSVLDAVITTLAAGNGGGPLTRRLATWSWSALRRLARGHHRVLSYGGAFVLLGTVLTWVVLLWAGWSLVFASADEAVVDATTHSSASIASRVYYAGFVVFTLGVGDVIAGSGTWQVLTSVASFLGLFLVTLSITYLVSVVSAAVGRRAMARSISLSGMSGVDIVRTHWDGRVVGGGWDSLAQTLADRLLQVTQQHLAYPVLHSFHASEPASSAPRTVAALDDAVLLMCAGLAEDARPSRAGLDRLIRAIDHYAHTVSGAGAGDHEPPGAPPLSALREHAIPTVTEQEYAAATRDHATRRRAVHALVSADAWSWPAAA
jgi:hypothetical protein